MLNYYYYNYLLFQFLYLVTGPGCSSLAYGAFLERGPFRPASDGKTLFTNPFAWNRGILINQKIYIYIYIMFILSIFFPPYLFNYFFMVFAIWKLPMFFSWSLRLVQGFLIQTQHWTTSTMEIKLLLQTIMPSW